MFAHKRTILLSAPAVQNGFQNPSVRSFVSVAFIRNFTRIPSAGNPGNVVIILARKHTDSESKFEDLVRPPRAYFDRLDEVEVYGQYEYGPK